MPLRKAYVIHEDWDFLVNCCHPIAIHYSKRCLKNRAFERWCFFFSFFSCGQFLVFIEFVTALLLFNVLAFWPRGMWDLSSPTRDWTCSPCFGRGNCNHWTAKEVPRDLIRLDIGSGDSDPSHSSNSNPRSHAERACDWEIVQWSSFGSSGEQCGQKRHPSLTPSPPVCRETMWEGWELRMNKSLGQTQSLLPRILADEEENLV